MINKSTNINKMNNHNRLLPQIIVLVLSVILSPCNFLEKKLNNILSFLNRFVQTIISSDQSEGGDFSYKSGDHFEVLAQLDSEWLYCINGKKEGLIRIEHVKTLMEDEQFKELHSDLYS